MEVNKNKYNCLFCNYVCSKKEHYERHLLTQKHVININGNKKSTKQFICECGKEYKNRHNLSRHKKTCNNINKNQQETELEKNKNSCLNHQRFEIGHPPISKINIESSEDVTRQDPLQFFKEINPISIFEIIKQNNEFKELMIQQNKDFQKQNKIFQEQNKEQLELINKFIEREPITAIYNNTNNNQTNNNQKFNLNIFLNETCKDAMNVNEFLDNLNPTVKDLEDVGEKGFVRGISDIILKSLKELDITKRPIHCTDIKREIVYLKENNIWSKDDNNNSRMKNIVRNVEDKNYFNIGRWQMEHPETRIMDSPDNLKHEKLIDVSCFAMYKEDKVRGKVIKELLKEIHINGK